MSKARTPNLFIVGAPKCGTTTLYEYLKLHPRIFMSDVKEPNFLNSDEDEKKMTKKKYLALFKTSKNHKYYGEASTHYLYSAEAIQSIKEMSPNAKIIISLRPPVELIYSAYFQHRANGHEQFSTFKEAYTVQDARRKGNYPPIGNEPMRRFIYDDLVKFQKYVGEYMDNFDSSNIHIVLLEDLKNNRKKTLIELYNFLDLKPFNIDKNIISNKSNQNKFQFINRLLISPPKIISKASSIIPSKLRSNIYSYINNLNKASMKKPKMNESLRREIVNKFLSEVEYVENLIDKNLDHWRV